MSRTETDSMGPIEIADDRLWGAQTQRSLENFVIGRDRYVWGRDVIRSLGLVKRAAALVNAELGNMEEQHAELIASAATEVIEGSHDDQFPLVVFQTGSGTQTNMNANEVIANRANQMAGSPLGSNEPIHPNDHVNRSQSSNDVFPTVMHLATLIGLHERLYPASDYLVAALDDLRTEHGNIVKVGRTHLQDATPITLGQEIGAWASQIRAAMDTIRTSESQLRALDIGGTATGTGLNAPAAFGARVAETLGTDLGLDLREAEDHFAATSAHDAIVNVSASLRTLAGALTKMANDIRWLASGPRNGIGELLLPANEPGSSIMPGKVNPTQAEAMTMVTARVFGNDTTIALAGTQGHFQLNVYKPVMLDCTLDSLGLLSDAMISFSDNTLVGLQPNRSRIADNLESNLMVVTALAPHIGYDRAAAIAKSAQSSGSSLREAAVASGHVTEADFDRWVDPTTMTGPG